MSTQAKQDHVAASAAPQHEAEDVVDSVIPVIHIVVPAFGAAMMFLLAFIAVNMA